MAPCCQDRATQFFGDIRMRKLMGLAVVIGCLAPVLAYFIAQNPSSSNGVGLHAGPPKDKKEEMKAPIHDDEVGTVYIRSTYEHDLWNEGYMAFLLFRKKEWQEANPKKRVIGFHFVRVQPAALVLHYEFREEKK